MYLHHGINPISTTTSIDANDCCVWLSSNLMPQPEMVANACKKPQRHQYHIQIALPPFHDDLDFKVSREIEITWQSGILLLLNFSSFFLNCFMRESNLRIKLVSLFSDLWQAPTPYIGTSQEMYVDLFQGVVLRIIKHPYFITILQTLDYFLFQVVDDFLHLCLACFFSPISLTLIIIYYPVFFHILTNHSAGTYLHT